MALIENGTIDEYYLERKRRKGIVGSIYKGRVVRVLPGMQAAFVDIGLEKAAFLYVGDVYGDPDFSEEFELTEGEHSERVPEVPTEQEAEEQEVKALAGEVPAGEVPAADAAAAEGAPSQPPGIDEPDAEPASDAPAILVSDDGMASSDVPGATDVPVAELVAEPSAPAPAVAAAESEGLAIPIPLTQVVEAGDPGLPSPPRRPTRRERYGRRAHGRRSRRSRRAGG